MMVSSADHEQLNNLSRDELIDWIVERRRVLGSSVMRWIYDDQSLEQLRVIAINMIDAEPVPDIDEPPATKPREAAVGKAEPKVKYRAVKTGEGYYNKMPVDAVVDPRLSNTDRTFLGLLLIHCREKDHCFVSNKTLAAEMPNERTRTTGVSVDTIQRCAASLAVHGYIEIIRPNATAVNTYRLTYTLRESKKD
jgi:hypothetical protein